MWTLRKKFGFRVAILFVWLVALSGCLSSLPGERTAVLPTLSSAPATPSLTPSITAIPITQAISPTIQATLPSLSPTSPPAVSSTPTEPPSATATTTPPEPIPPGWIALVDIADSIDILRTDGTGRRSIVESVEYPSNPAWSPDGQWIAFIGSPALNSDSQIYLVRPDGSELKRLTFTSGYKNSLTWAPDGQAIVYSQTSGPRGQTEVDLFVYEINPPRIRQITNTPGVYEYNPAYSPRGDAIAFTSVGRDDQPHIFKLMIMNPDGSNARQVLETPMNVGSFAWSPDGNWIVFSSSGTETSVYACNDLYLVNLNGSELQRLTDGHEWSTFPSWSLDGEWIAFTLATCNYPAAPGFEQIYVIHSNGSRLQKLADTLKTESPAWSPWPALQTGRTFTLTALGANLKLRSEPSLSGTVLDWLKEDEKIFVLEGPVEADEYLWYLVRVDSNGKEGWIADNPGWFFGERTD